MLRRETPLLRERQAHLVIGSLETVVLPDGRVIIAKVDTGAALSSIHCDVIERFDEDGKAMLRFQLSEGSGRAIETEHFKETRIRSSNGSVESRFIVDMPVGLGGQTYLMAVTLSRRPTMRYGMLIGKRFLIEHSMLVNVSEDYLLSERLQGQG